MPSKNLSMTQHLQISSTNASALVNDKPIAPSDRHSRCQSKKHLLIECPQREQTIHCILPVGSCPMERAHRNCHCPRSSLVCLLIISNASVSNATEQNGANEHQKGSTFTPTSPTQTIFLVTMDTKTSIFESGCREHWKNNCCQQPTCLG